MRLKSIFISSYKNLKNMKVSFDRDSFVDVFVGKNGSGKSNFFEAVIQIFQHLYEYDKDKTENCFEYSLNFEIEGESTEIEWANGQFTVNGITRKTIGNTRLPDNILIYYSGHNNTVAQLVDKYEDGFRKHIKKADVEDSRRFIGVGSKYKELLLSVLLMQKNDSTVRKFVCKKLSINEVSPTVTVVLKRPLFADKKVEIDQFESETYYWGIKGITRQFLDRLTGSIKGAFSYGELYNLEDDCYRIPINVELFQTKFFSEKASDIFRMFDNLKMLGMLANISAPLTLGNGLAADISNFSDGQFQSVYIYAIIELFKDRNCITLLDEPDSFLHPEWQFEFLKQVIDISDTATKNHVLISSHSAVTLIPHKQKDIMLFQVSGGNLNCHRVNKKYAINQLSSEMMRYSEKEQILSILYSVNIEKKPVLFTEGSSDVIILNEAWNKLFKEPIPFIPIYAFNCIYLRAILQDERVYNELGGKPMFGLFDFDEAYNEWNYLKGTRSETDPYKGLRIDIQDKNGFAFMLPVPSLPIVEKLVIANKDTKETYKNKSRLSIEHLFYSEIDTKSYFNTENTPGGQVLVFKDGEKTKFAQEVVPALEKHYFEAFRPMFEFIASKC